MRDEFTKATADLLARRCGHRCSNPSCRAATTGPDQTGSGAINVGVAAHITAACAAGPRFDESLSSDQRRAPANGIWLCQTCAKLVDSDLERFPCAVLRNWKERAELEALAALQASPVFSGTPIAHLERVLDGHTNFVWDVAITPDARRVVSASNDSTARMWDIASGNQLALYTGHDAFLCSLAISANGEYLATGAADGQVICFHLNSARRCYTFHHGAPDAKVSWGPSDDRLASAGADGKIRVWELPSTRCSAEILVHEGPILKIVFLDDGDRVVSVSADRTVRVCSLSSQRCVTVLHGHTGEVNSVAVSSDKQRLVSGSEDCTLRLWDLNRGDCLRTFYGHRTVVWRVAMSPDGRIAASGSADNTVRLWDLEQGDCVQELAHPDCVAAVAFASDGKRLAVGCDDTRVYVYSIAGLAMSESPVGGLRRH